MVGTGSGARAKQPRHSLLVCRAASAREGTCHQGHPSETTRAVLSLRLRPRLCGRVWGGRGGLEWAPPHLERQTGRRRRGGSCSRIFPHTRRLERVVRHTASGAPPPLVLGVPRLGRGTCPTSLRHVRNIGGVLCRSTRAFACARTLARIMQKPCCDYHDGPPKLVAREWQARATSLVRNPSVRPACKDQRLNETSPYLTPDAKQRNKSEPSRSQKRQTRISCTRAGRDLSSAPGMSMTNAARKGG